VISVDTNILVRYAVKDVPIQTHAATDFLRNNSCQILKTVLLELVWVLSSSTGYNLPRNIVVERLRHILGLPTIEPEDALAVAQAIDWYEQGLDFADALHLASSSLPDGLATMDRRLSAKAGSIGCDRRITVVG
jgi:predicted nucleic-acid-binding protein